jgi:galactokinase
MIEFKKMDASGTRLAEIEIALKKLAVEMASPNIKEIKHQELTKLRNQLDLEQATLRTSVKRGE